MTTNSPTTSEMTTGHPSLVPAEVIARRKKRAVIWWVVLAAALIALPLATVITTLAMPQIRDAVSLALALFVMAALITAVVYTDKAGANLQAQRLREQRALLVYARPSGPEWSRTRWMIARRDNWTCVTGCGTTGLSFQNNNGPTSAHVDHIVPLAKGGHPSDPRNLQLLCGPCNLAKGAADVAPWAR